MEFLEILKTQLVLPLLIGCIGVIIYLSKYYMDKVSKSIVIKNEMATMEKETAVRNQVIQTIAEGTKSAVALNMDTANLLKEHGGFLSENEITELNQSAINLVLASLPSSLTDEDGALSKLIGGQEKLISIIKLFMERYVYEYKLHKENKKEIKEDKKNLYISPEELSETVFRSVG